MGSCLPHWQHMVIDNVQDGWKYLNKHESIILIYNIQFENWKVQ